MALVPLKKCCKCQQDKNATEYTKRFRNADGLDSYCKECKKLFNKPSPKKHVWQRSLSGRATSLRQKAKQRAENKSLEFNITKEFILSKLKNGKCEVTNIPFDFVDIRTMYSPSIDRINSNLGYTLENTRMVVWIYNAMKNTFSDEDVNNFIKQIEVNR